MTDTDSRRTLILQTWEAAWDRGEVDAFDDLLSPDYRRLGADDEGEDRTQFKASIITTRAAFPDLVTVIDDIVIEGDRVAIRWHSKGHHEHSLLGVPATHRNVEVSGATFGRFDGDLIVEEYVTWDPRALLAALGIISVGQDH
jgi:steroid delta-isomerase-like uncharacterized protein